MNCDNILSMSYDDFEKRILEVCRDKKVVFIFLSKESEVETRLIIKELLSQGKIVVVPVTEAKGATMKTVRLTSLKNLTTGAFNICEPQEKIIFPKKDIDIFLVPGVVFDKEGNRKGRGKGYFDRFLVEVKGKKPIIGLCYENQVVEKIETNIWDISVDFVIAKPFLKNQ